MQPTKKTFEDFYAEIRREFPKINELETWGNYDWKTYGHENSLIMADLSEEIANWVVKGHNTEALRFMELIERYWHEGDKSVTSYIYTDFLTSIMEVKKDVREIIKSMMGSETMQKYIELLNGYRELEDWE